MNLKMIRISNEKRIQIVNKLKPNYKSFKRVAIRRPLNEQRWREASEKSRSGSKHTKYRLWKYMLDNDIDVQGYTRSKIIEMVCELILRDQTEEALKRVGSIMKNKIIISMIECS